MVTKKDVASGMLLLTVIFVVIAMVTNNISYNTGYRQGYENAKDVYGVTEPPNPPQYLLEVGKPLELHNKTIYYLGLTWGYGYTYPKGRVVHIGIEWVYLGIEV